MRSLAPLAAAAALLTTTPAWAGPTAELLTAFGLNSAPPTAANFRAAPTGYSIAQFRGTGSVANPTGGNAVFGNLGFSCMLWTGASANPANFTSANQCHQSKSITWNTSQLQVIIPTRSNVFVELIVKEGHPEAGNGSQFRNQNQREDFRFGLVNVATGLPASLDQIYFDSHLATNPKREDDAYYRESFAPVTLDAGAYYFGAQALEGSVEFLARIYFQPQTTLPPPGTTQASAPATLALLGVGLAALARRRRRA